MAVKYENVPSGKIDLLKSLAVCGRVDDPDALVNNRLSGGSAKSRSKHRKHKILPDVVWAAKNADDVRADGWPHQC